jgi:DNA-binding transcriptional LysR family regulator
MERDLRFSLRRTANKRLELTSKIIHKLQRGEIHLRELRSENFVLYPRRPRPSFADHILDICQKGGFLPSSQVLAQDYQSAISLVSVGVGISLVPKSVSRSHRHGVAYRPYVGFNPGTAISLNVRLDNQAIHVRNFLEVANKFVQHLRK